MSLIEINEELCSRDGICTQECPMAIIRQKEDKSIPQLVAGGEQICISCGHCVAVCTKGALSHQYSPLESSPPIDNSLTLNKEQIVQFLRSRRSIRQFKDKPVEKEVLQQLIELARYAPTGSNVQTVNWTVITNKKELTELSSMTVAMMREFLEGPNKAGLPPYLPTLVKAWDKGMDVILRNTPALVVASTPGESRNGLVDLSIALSYLELSAQAWGLGCCWAGLLQMAMLYSKPVKEYVGLPEGHINHYPMMVGYPKFRYHRMPERKDPNIIWRQ